MTGLIADRQEFEQTMEALGTVLRLDQTFPAQVLKTAPASFFLFDDTLVFTAHFDEIRQELFRMAGGVPLYFASLEPDPVGYFFAHFGKYPLIRYDTAVDGDGFRKPLNEDPGGSPADAIMTNTERFAMFPRDLSWLLYADRGWELAIAVAFVQETAAQLLSAFPADVRFDAEGALQDLLEPVYRGGVPEDFRRELLMNYGSGDSA
ncbi:MAG TPA: hypothetical protein VE010_23275 [Thermoanaerobaculia bacterium]|nr:hypothetical protein [Thermoanaerobaculia bacterium]